MTLIKTEGLFDGFSPEISAQIRSSEPGMAHFAGTGPIGMTCRECNFFAHENRYYSNGGKHGGKLKPAPCRKYRSLMNIAGPAIEPHLSACKYFNENLAPPKLHGKS